MSHNQATVYHVANTCHRSQTNDAVTCPRLQIVAEAASVVRFVYLLAFVRYNLQAEGWERVFRTAVVRRAILPYAASL